MNNDAENEEDCRRRRARWNTTERRAEPVFKLPFRRQAPAAADAPTPATPATPGAENVLPWLGWTSAWLRGYVFCMVEVFGRRLRSNCLRRPISMAV